MRRCDTYKLSPTNKRTRYTYMYKHLYDMKILIYNNIDRQNICTFFYILLTDKEQTKLCKVIGKNFNIYFYK